VAPDVTTTRERLVAAARELIEEGGYAAAPVAAIARRAGVADGALYRHFPSKAELFLEVFRDAAEADLDAMRAAAAEAATPAERLDAVVATYARRALASPRRAWALVYEPVDALVDAERLAYRRAYRDGMAELVREGVDAGAFAPADPQLTAAAIVGAIAETLVGPLSPVREGAQPEKEVVAALVAVCRRIAGAR
jgi:AcrR family transcriptional regulator